MIQIIKNNNKKRTVFETNCQCGCKLRFNSNDIQQEKHILYIGETYTGNTSKGEYTREYITCPNCDSILYNDTYNFEIINEDKNV